MNLSHLQSSKPEIFISPDWGHGHTRRCLSKDLEQSLHAGSTKPYYSISHTRGFGGYVTHQKPIGFDMELKDRTVSKRAISRLFSTIELGLGASPIELWVMKEAAFKAHRLFDQPKTITKVGLTRYENMDGYACFEYGIYTNDFKYLNPGGQGRLWSDDPLILAFALKNSTLV